eukprot:gnl/MRDRNA2_/MRDRNA2_63501_c0_seq2.p3 gnl/MRDRNA2_/MRDRNA2_63501_c0~~gnl/MRDRNA2_/MRDRNA2_63501_c0_seq2.p3  ORF type:complete len:106 (+),score=13.92 gnl/MRDRNA2_/MRDRNA2_63501_c0_seq2:416-733(+)
MFTGGNQHRSMGICLGKSIGFAHVHGINKEIGGVYGRHPRAGNGQYCMGILGRNPSGGIVVSGVSSQSSVVSKSFQAMRAWQYSMGIRSGEWDTSNAIFSTGRRC